MKNPHIGSDFDDFLDGEGLRADAEATAIKRVIAYQIELEMRQAKLSKTAMAEKCTPAAPPSTGSLILQTSR